MKRKTGFPGTLPCRAIMFLSLMCPLLLMAEGSYGALITYNRMDDFNAASNIMDGDNVHGGVQSPNGSLWSYSFLTESSRITYGGVDPGQFQSVDAYSDTMYRALELNGGTTVANLNVTDSALSNYWNRDDLNPVLRNADLFAVFTAPQSGIYDLTGSLQWSQSTYQTGSGGMVTVGTVQDGAFTSLLEEAVGDLLDQADLNTLFDVSGYSGNPLLTGLTLDEGDQIVYGIRGKASPHQFRTMLLYDMGLNVELAQLPEPGVLFFIGTGLLMIVMQRHPVVRTDSE